MGRPDRGQPGETWTDDDGFTWEWAEPPGSWVLAPQDGPLTDVSPDEGV